MLGLGLDMIRSVKSDDSGFDVFLDAGQSNTYFGTTTDASDVYKPDIFQLGHYLADDGIIIPAAEPLDHYYTRSTGAAGFMRTFIDDYVDNGYKKENRPILIVGGALNGTGFSDNRWNKGDDLYENLVARAISVLSLPGARLKGIFMQMGERDSESTPELWQQRCTDFCINIKNDIGKPYSSAPIVFGGMLPSWAAQTQARTDVDSRMKIINTYVEFGEYASPYVPTVLTEHVGDGLHYNVVSQRELGHRYFTAYLAALNNSFTRSVADPINDLAPTLKPNYDVQLDWTSPPNSYPYVDSFNIYYKETGSGEWLFFENTTSVQSLVTGLLAETSYDFSVRSVNFSGESLDSNVAQATTELNPISYTHEFRYEFDNDLNNGVGGTGTGFGSVTYTNDGERGNVYGLGTATMGVETGHTIPANSSFTKTFWFKAVSNTVQHLMSSGDASGSSIMFQSSKFRVGSLANAYAISQSDTAPSGWNHCIVTYDESTDELKLYVNNVEKGSTTLADTGSHTIFVGNRNTKTNGCQSYMDDARLYARVLNPSERAQVFAGDEI